MSKWERRITAFFDIAVPTCVFVVIMLMWYAIDRCIVAAFGGQP